MEIKHDFTEEVRRAIPESIQIAQVRTSKTPRKCAHIRLQISSENIGVMMG